jgi:endonuclease/exonuclease/phosphatase family metal-dependent hydrolase
VARLGVVALCALSGAACAFPYGGMTPVGLDVDCKGVAPHDADAGSEVGLLWVRPDDAREQELGSAWCETVGEPVYVAAPDRPIETGPDDSLVVVSWNMNVGGGDLRSLIESELAVSCTDAASGGGHPFVLLVQEAYRRSTVLPPVGSSSLVPPTIDPEAPGEQEMDITELAEVCGLSLAYVPSMRNGPDSGTRPHEDKGNAILSNLPLASPVAIDLPFETYRRVAVGAELDVGGRLVRLVSVHLDVSALPYRLLVSGNQSRARQASGLIEALDSLNAERFADGGTVVGGDLNSWASQETAVRLMRRAFPESPPDDGLATRGVFPTDHVFFRTEADDMQVSTYRVLESDYGSDHRGRALLLTRGEAGTPVQ